MGAESGLGPLRGSAAQDRGQRAASCQGLEPDIAMHCQELCYTDVRAQRLRGWRVDQGVTGHPHSAKTRRQECGQQASDVISSG